MGRVNSEPDSLYQPKDNACRQSLIALPHLHLGFCRLVELTHWRAAYPYASYACSHGRLAARVASNDREHFTGNVTGAAGRGEEYERWSNFLGLGRALHRCVAAELGDLLGLLVGRVERGPDRTGRDRIHSDATINQMGSER